MFTYVLVRVLALLAVLEKWKNVFFLHSLVLGHFLDALVVVCVIVRLGSWRQCRRFWLRWRGWLRLVLLILCLRFRLRNVVHVLNDAKNLRLVQTDIFLVLWHCLWSVFGPSIHLCVDQVI